MSTLQSIKSASATSEPNVYRVVITADTDSDGLLEDVDFILRPDDNYGLAPAVRARLQAALDAKTLTIGPYVPPPAPTIEQVRAAMPALTPRQIRLGFVNAGRDLASIDTAIAAIPDATERERAQISWQFATQFVRTDPLVAEVAAALGLSDTDVDSMWTAASAL